MERCSRGVQVGLAWLGGIQTARTSLFTIIASCNQCWSNPRVKNHSIIHIIIIFATNSSKKV